MTRVSDTPPIGTNTPFASALERIATALETIAGARHRPCDFSAADAFVFTSGTLLWPRFRASTASISRCCAGSIRLAISFSPTRRASRKASRPTTRSFGGRAAWANPRSSRPRRQQSISGLPVLRRSSRLNLSKFTAKISKGCRTSWRCCGPSLGASSFFATICPSMAPIPATNRSRPRSMEGSRGARQTLCFTQRQTAATSFPAT